MSLLNAVQDLIGDACPRCQAPLESHSGYEVALCLSHEVRILMAEVEVREDLLREARRIADVWHRRASGAKND